MLHEVKLTSLQLYLQVLQLGLRSIKESQSQKSEDCPFNSTIKPTSTFYSHIQAKQRRSRKRSTNSNTADQVFLRCLSDRGKNYIYVRPVSNVVLLPCRKEFDFSTVVARRLKPSRASYRRVVRDGSSTTWFQTSFYRCAELNS